MFSLPPTCAPTKCRTSVAYDSRISEMFQDAAAKWAMDTRHRPRLEWWFRQDRAQCFPPPPTPDGEAVFFTHPSLKLGRGGIDAYTGIAADGRVVMLELYDGDDDCIDAGVEFLRARAAVPGIVQLVGACSFSEDSLRGGVEIQAHRQCIALEHMEYSLTDLVAHWKKHSLLGAFGHYEAVQRIVKGILEILVDLHKRDIVLSSPLVHRDLKPDNILFDREDNVHLIDFGLRSLLAQQLRSTRPTSQTLEFLAEPELMGDSGASAVHLDMYSLAMITLHMFTGSSCPRRQRILTPTNIIWPLRLEIAQHFLSTLLAREVDQLDLLLTHPMFWDETRLVKEALSLWSSAH